MVIKIHFFGKKVFIELIPWKLAGVGAEKSVISRLPTTLKNAELNTYPWMTLLEKRSHPMSERVVLISSFQVT